MVSLDNIFLATCAVLPVVAGSRHSLQPAQALAPRATAWVPAVGASWQIELSVQVSDTSADYEIFDFDMFDNSAATITKLHVAGRHAICYFSAGTYENWRSDSDSFTDADMGAALPDWDGEWWLDTNSPNVRSIMKKRIALAKSKGCDAIDPDNIDAYNTGAGGIGLTAADALSYITFLATEAHAVGMSIGLKNALEIVPKALPLVDFAVNESCVEYSECSALIPFISAGKPVFHIEYPTGERRSVKSKQATTSCKAPTGFSSILKDEDLDSWIQVC
ncbi:glycoside hydrolase superfamily [Calycina marina]|uniref:alpha-galactosidase n=1 Tax=Calycina marina TaxID=1763456 RepID=A0A9P8CG47_9HELO|nr:glycoside hydrolase superfamily [Calycina marina]